ncbi:MAG: ATP-binding protein, partial [Bacteroidota bacterium]
EGKITFANKSSSTITGYSHDELISMDVSNLLSSSEKQELQQRINKREMDDDSLFTYQVEIINKDQEPVPLEISSVPIVKNTNKEFLVIGRDISQRRKYEEQLIEAKEKAEENDRLKSTFLANMSHEIRTPLNAILGFSMLMQEDTDDENLKQKYLNIIHDNGEHLLNIMNNILEFSRIEAGQAKLNIWQVQVPAILTEAFESNRDQLERKNLQFRLDISLSNQHNIIMSDSTRIRQVLDNLISNAVKFTDKGEIKISCESISEDEIQIGVTDTGRGIKPEDREIIFERFRQGSIAKGEIHSGTGLGLSISRSLVKMLGGRIWLNSEINKGTEVFFTIKTNLTNNVSSKKPITMKTPSDNNPVKKEGKTILIVEDEDSNYMFLETILQKENHNVFRASDGIQAMEIFHARQNEIDMILMDIKIPRINGLTVTRKVKEIKPGIPVIAQTAYAMPGDKEKALEAGCDDYVSKPLSREEVLQKINQF